MDFNDISKLLTTISVYYPGFRKNITTKSGDMIRIEVVREWFRTIGYMDYEDALGRLDAYLMGPNAKSPPGPMDFRKTMPSVRHNYYQSDHNFDRLDPKGRLADDAGRLYAFPDRPDEEYHYDASMRILDSKGNFVK